MIRTVIVEDSPVAQQYLSDMLEKDGRFEVLVKYTDAFEAEAFCVSGGADLVLMDVQTAHNHSGLAAGERIRRSGCGAKVVAVTSLVDPEVLARARSGCADSLWYKDHGDEGLLGVIDRTLAGERVFPDSAPSIELKNMFSGEITPRQFALLRCILMGMTQDEIAEKLHMTKNGVRWNLTQLIEKGGFENKFELFIALAANKLVVTNLLDEKTEEA